jgi:hypothetical protein
MRGEASVIASWILDRFGEVGRAVVARDPLAVAQQWIGAGFESIGEWFSPSNFKNDSRMEASTQNVARTLGFGKEMSRWLAGRDLVSGDKVQSEWKQNTFAGSLLFFGMISRLSGMAAMTESAPTVTRGYISGDYRLLRDKVRAARAGDVDALGEIETAKLLRSEGKNVHFQTPVGPRGAGTADFLVGGEPGTGVGGVVTDVLTPISSKPGSVVRSIADKNNQAPNIIVNLRSSSATEWQIGTETRPGTTEVLGDVMQRVREGFDARNIRSVRIINTGKR